MASLPYDSLPSRPLHLTSALRAGKETRAPQAYRLGRSGRVGYAVPEFPRDCLIRLLEFPELPFRTSTRETVKAGRTALIVKADLPIGGRMMTVAYKRVRRRNWLKLLTQALRGNRTLRVWRVARRLEKCGIATARPLAVVVPRWGAFQRDSFLVTSWVADACQVDALLQQPPDARPPVHDTAARSLGALVGRMHAARISHRDLKTSNLLIRIDGPRASAHVIDLDGAAVRFRLTRRIRIRNLARLAIDVDPFASATRSRRLRFLKAYVAADGGRGGDWKSLWREIAGAGESLRARKARRGRR